MVFIQLRLQEAEVPELLHKDVILLLQIFLNLLIFIHESRPKQQERDKGFMQEMMCTLHFGIIFV